MTEGLTHATSGPAEKTSHELADTLCPRLPGRVFAQGLGRSNEERRIAPLELLVCREEFDHFRGDGGISNVPVESQPGLLLGGSNRAARWPARQIGPFLLLVHGVLRGLCRRDTVPPIGNAWY